MINIIYLVFLVISLTLFISLIFRKINKAKEKIAAKANPGWSLLKDQYTLIPKVKIPRLSNTLAIILSTIINKPVRLGQFL